MKKGYQTSEFWLTTLASLLTIGNQSGLIGAPIPVEAIVTIATMVLGYTGGRSYAKGK